MPILSPHANVLLSQAKQPCARPMTDESSLRGYSDQETVPTAKKGAKPLPEWR
jgi:hypothetical protein